SSSTPVTVTGVTGAVAITAGGTHTCARLADGTAKCWGNNGSGQLGNGNTTSSSTPVTATGLAHAVAITAGGTHTRARLADGSARTCGLLVDGTAKCWGNNASGQLGTGSTTNAKTPAVVVGYAPAGEATEIVAAHHSSCVVLANGTAKCWGNNMAGELGTGDK